MNDHVLLDLLNELEKAKIVGLAEHFIAISQRVHRSTTNTGAQMLDSIYHMT